MKEIVLATRNKDKGAELAALLSDMGIRIRTLAEFPDMGEVEEDGDTCSANAIKKAVAVAKHTGLIALADDTGLSVHALGGKPGVRAARFAGEGATYEDNWRKLLHEMEGTPEVHRGARFLTVAAIATPAGEIQTADGVLDGVITEEPVGEGGFGYDPVFYVPQLGRTLAQLSPEDKNCISHRALAFGKAKALLLAIGGRSRTVGA